jgi:hypothetical protein
MAASGPTRAEARSRWRDVLTAYGLTGLGACALAVVVFELWRMDIGVPLDHDNGDGVFHRMLVQNALEQGWHTASARLGMPFGQDLREWPLPEIAQHAPLWMLAHLFGTVAAVNLYYLMGFPLIALCALYVIRRLGVSRGAAVIVSLLYAFLPYHLLRGQGHLFLSTYYVVPLLVGVALWLWTDERLLFSRDAAGGRLRFRWRSRAALATAIVCLLAATTAKYYAFFGVFLWWVAATGATVRRRSAAALLTALVLTVAVGATTAVALAPTWLQRMRSEANPEFLARSVRSMHWASTTGTDATTRRTARRWELSPRRGSSASSCWCSFGSRDARPASSLRGSPHSTSLRSFSARRGAWARCSPSRCPS